MNRELREWLFGGAVAIGAAGLVLVGIGVLGHGVAAVIRAIKADTPRAVLGDGAKVLDIAPILVMSILAGLGGFLLITLALGKADSVIKERPSTIPPTLLALLSTLLLGAASKVTEEWSGAASWLVGALPPVCAFFGTEVYSVWASSEGGARRASRVVAWVLIAAPLVILGVGAASSDYVDAFLGLSGLDQALVAGGIAMYALAVVAAVLAMRSEDAKANLARAAA